MWLLGLVFVGHFLWPQTAHHHQVKGVRALCAGGCTGACGARKQAPGAIPTLPPPPHRFAKKREARGTCVVRSVVHKARALRHRPPQHPNTPTPCRDGIWNQAGHPLATASDRATEPGGLAWLAWSGRGVVWLCGCGAVVVVWASPTLSPSRFFPEARDVSRCADCCGPQPQ